MKYWRKLNIKKFSNHFSVLFFFTISTLPLFAQTRYSIFPHSYNSFINNSNISLAIEVNTSHVFQTKSFNLHKYLLDGQKKGDLNSYTPWELQGVSLDSLKKIDDYYYEVDKKYLTPPNYFKDSLASVKFQEIFYLENNKLKSHIISAGSEYSIITETGINLGNSPFTLTSLNFYNSKAPKINDEIISLGNTYYSIDFDFWQTPRYLKKTYDMTFVTNLWYDLSIGFNTVKDLKMKRNILSKDIMDYALIDSMDHEIFNEDGTLQKIEKIRSGIVLNYLSDIGISQDWFYNKTQNYFYNKVNKAYIYVKYQDLVNHKEVNEKRFEITF